MPHVNTLIVEDELLLSEILVDTLKKNPYYKVIGCVDRLDTAKVYLSRYNPQLILLDNILPDGRGIDFIRHCIAENYQGHIIIISADNHMDTISDAIRLGAFDYLIKPVNHQRLMQTLHRLLLFRGCIRSNDHASQYHVDSLFDMQGRESSQMTSEASTGINEDKLDMIQKLFVDTSVVYTVETISSEIGCSKPTARRYLEHSVRNGFLKAEVLFGKRGRPERIYRLKIVKY